VRLPIVGRPVPIIADDYADPEKGSGAVKITPAHDFNDFKVGQRHGLPVISILDAAARINENAPADYRGLDRFEARKKVVARFEELGLLRGIDPTRHAVPHGDRSGAVIEPFLTDQWYVDAKTLAGPAIAAVEEGRTVFEPAHWAKTYFEWMRNIEPWCVSRQLWWGHRIPAWYGPDGSVFVEETEAAALAASRERFGRDVPLSQDEDVLDTWFSSGLWAFSTLGWPEETEDLKRFYPTDTLVTGFDIIFFWVARMMMLGQHFMGSVPFRRVVINGLVRDEKGQKMSKSKGNVIDPLAIVDELGADALRFTMAITSGARDIKLSKARIEGYRNFGTKLWNAARFCQMNECAVPAGFEPATLSSPLNRWLRGEVVRAGALVTDALEGGRFDEAAEALYRFIWNGFCDWYLELAKPVLNGADARAKAETRAAAAWALDQALRLLHPVSPFITEALWGETGEFDPARSGMLIEAAWPDLPAEWVDPAADAEIGLVVAAISEGRSLRAELRAPPSARPPLLIVEASDEARRILLAAEPVIAQMLRVSAVRVEPHPPEGALPFVAEGVTLALPLADLIDLKAERTRLAKEVEALEVDIARTAKKLANADFVARAPAEVVQENRDRLEEAQASAAKLSAALARLERAGVG
jgi:valyl-tRNA synthetase